MSFASNFIKKKQNNWHYYPYGTVLEDISMPIIEGRKVFLESALNDEMKFAFIAPVLVVLLVMIKPWLLFLGVFFIPLLILKRRRSVKQNCQFISYPLSIWLKNYNKINIHFADPNNFMAILLGEILVILMPISVYSEEGFSTKVILVGIIPMIGLYALYVYYQAWKNRKNNPNYIKPQTWFTKENTYRAIFKFVLTPIIILCVLFTYLHFFMD